MESLGLFSFTDCLQGCLLAISLWFVWRDRKAAKIAYAGDRDGDADRLVRNREQTPLSSNGHADSS
jgi:hypothetical protein